MGSLAGALGKTLEAFLPDACFDLGLVAWGVRGSPLRSTQGLYPGPREVEDCVGTQCPGNDNQLCPFLCQNLLQRRGQCGELQVEELRLRVGSLSWKLPICCGLWSCVGLESRPGFAWSITSSGG